MMFCNFIVSCLYTLDAFIQKIDGLFSNLDKMHIVCGDFNITLLQFAKYYEKNRLYYNNV